MDQIKDFDVWSPKKELPIVILLKNGGCYVLDYFNNVLNLFQKGKYFFILIHKSDSKIIRVIQNIMRPIKREENLDYDTDFQKYLKVKDNIAQNRYFELNEKNVINIKIIILIYIFEANFMRQIQPRDIL